MEPILKRILILVFVFFPLYCRASTYYVDSSTGNDHNTGTSQKLPWKTIARVNRHLFLPGDTLLFASGAVWNESLAPQGSGAPGHPIVLSSYGEGSLPLIAGTGFTGTGVLSLYNQSYWEMSNLELTNDASDFGDRRGVEVKAENGGLICHIYLKNLLIHHIKGIPGNKAVSKRTAGIFFVVTDDVERPTRFDDIRIEDCTIRNVINQGIALNNEKFETTGYPGDETWDERKFTNVTIRNNVIYRISKNAMIIRMTEGGVVEHNLCFETATHLTGNTIFSRNVRGTVFQYNEGFLNKSHDHDGSFYDPDLCSPGTVWQYSYSHDNAHGLLWICTNPKDNDVVVRYNISENDRGYLVYYNYPFTNVDVYRNIFYAGRHVAPFLIRENPQHRHEMFSFKNNFVYSESDNFSFEYAPELLLQSEKNKSNRNIRGNTYRGIPLKGSYVNEEFDWSTFPKFHRGFHYQPDQLDFLFFNPIPDSELAKNQPDREWTVIATVNGIPVYDWELMHQENKLRYLQFTLNSKELKEMAVERIRFLKVQQEYMVRKGMIQADWFRSLNALCSSENRFRKKHDDLKEVVFFGPVQYSFADYYEYFMANVFQQLKIAMVNDELISTEKEWQDHFEDGDKFRIDAAWEKRGYEYSLNAIQQSLLDRKYDAFFEQKAKEAQVIVF